jgi:hypothetical protein
MKNLSLLLFLCFPVFVSAQSLNGVYTGVLSNDSTTIRKDQSFEMALTEYNGKVFGYAYSTFIVNDTLYYIVKRVKGNIEGDICEVEDDEVISHNFPQKPEKKVYVTYTLRRNASGNTWTLDGNWKTNATKKYYAISGKVDTKEEKDLGRSKLYEHLGDLDLQKTLGLIKPKEKSPAVKPVTAKEGKADIAKNTVKNEEKNSDTKTADQKADVSIVKDDAVTKNIVIEKKSEAVVAKTELKTPENKITSVSLNNSSIQNEKKDIPPSDPDAVVKKSENSIAKTDTRIPDNKTVPVATNNSQVQHVTGASQNKNISEKKPDAVIVKNDTKLPDNKPTNTIVNTPSTQNEKKDARVNKNPETNIVKTENKPGTTPTLVNNQPKQVEKKNTIAIPADKNVETGIAKVDSRINDPGSGKNEVNISPTQNEKKDVAVPGKKQDPEFEFQEIRRTNRKLKPASALVDGRISVPSETIYFYSDSLSIALYDNGEVDGDSVSVIINDEIFIEKQLLKSSAFRKTFYVPYDQSDSLLVVLYAENLGKYPPNTGLLQIKDGEEIFYVRFKADLDKNAAIILRRKYK